MDNQVEQYVTIWRKYYDEQELKMKKVRALRHDMQAHMIVLQHYLNVKDYEKAQSYLCTLRECEGLQSESQIDVGNGMVNAILQDKICNHTVAFDFSYEGQLPEDCGISDMDLCTIFSNLISNAVEACEKLEKMEKKISLQIAYNTDEIQIVMSNPIEWEIEKGLLGSGTGKEDKINHGHGIGNIQRAVKRNQGNIEFVVNENIFEVSIQLHRFVL